ncbi:hypothetical protein ACXYMU_16870 [Pontibacter sp. CAU 1760]
MALHQNDWDEEKYKLLNAHFRQQIKRLLAKDPYLAEAAATGKSLQLEDIVHRLSAKDQLLWEEFIMLDRIKLHLDLNNHLEGRGTPYDPRTGFGDTQQDAADELDNPW